MSLSTAEWHQRYLQQAGWSAEFRRLIYSFPWFKDAQNILEIGCGTGAILHEIVSNQKNCIIGLDIEDEPLAFASSIINNPNLVQADGYFTPFPNSVFDVTFCHYLLLWIKFPNRIIEEMLRVTRPGGWIIAFAEPDYGGRLDFPTELEALGKMQIQSLIAQGANPYTGRTIRTLLVNSKLEDVTCGIFGAQWSLSQSIKHDKEMDTLQSDYEMLNNSPEIISHEQFLALQQKDFQAWKNQTRILFVPTFYAWGKVGEK